MKFLLLTPLIFLLSSPIKAEANNAKHEKCLQAADYEGCMDFETNQKKSTISSSEKDCSKTFCNTNEISQKFDHLGMPIPKGWIFRENLVKQVAYYYDPVLYKINSGGETGRFFHTRSMVRFFRKGKQGSSGYFSNSGSGSIDCSQSLYGNINCTTTPSTSTFIPGSPSVPPQVIQRRIDYIYDCEDHTLAKYIDNKIVKEKGIDGKRRKWQSIDNVEGSVRSYRFTKDRTNMKNLICPNKGNDSKIEHSDLYEFREKGIKKRGSSNKKNIGNINCDSSVWRDKPRCN